jgi:hypothetical protein
MVRNTTGGSKTKSQARKSFKDKDTNDTFTSLRTPQNEFEQIAIVTKLLGNGMCYVSIPSLSTLPLICHIRGKFRGRSKKNNIVNIGSTILVGLRDWETPHFKNTDLLQIILNNTNNNNNNNNTLHNNNEEDIIFSNTSTTTPHIDHHHDHPHDHFDIHDFDDFIDI